MLYGVAVRIKRFVIVRHCQAAGHCLTERFRLLENAVASDLFKVCVPALPHGPCNHATQVHGKHGSHQLPCRTMCSGIWEPACRAGQPVRFVHSVTVLPIPLRSAGGGSEGTRSRGAHARPSTLLISLSPPRPTGPAHLIDSCLGLMGLGTAYLPCPHGRYTVWVKPLKESAVRKHLSWNWCLEQELRLHGHGMASCALCATSILLHS